MGISTATLNSLRVTDARVNMPEWGCWYAEVTTDGEQSLTGKVTLVIADLTLVGTVLSGGPTLGKSTYRIVGGAGGWGKTIDSKSYANDLGVKISTVLTDAAISAGETLDISTTDRVGPAWTRQNAPACTVLNLIAPKAWYVGEDGKTRLGKRPSVSFTGQAQRIQKADLMRGKVVLAAPAIATLIPGVIVDGITAVDVQHEISVESGLRTTIWGKQAKSSLDGFKELFRQLDPDRDFRGVTEYRVVLQHGDVLDLQPVRVSTGMPDLPRVPMFPGVAGARLKPALGSRVLVGFVDSDPARPYVAGFESASAALGLTLVTDGIGAGGHAVTLEQVLGLFAQYTAARFLVSDMSISYLAAYGAAPAATLALLMAAMINGAVLPPGTPVGPTPGPVLDALGLPALITTALAAQLPDPASLGLPTPVMPGLAKANLKL